MISNLSLSDYLEIRALQYEWADSYDTKDWPRLRKTLAPQVTLDFRKLGGTLHENLSPDGYVEILTAILGNKRLASQHHLGAQKWECLSDGRVHVWSQARVAHMLYADDEKTVMENHGHGHGYVEHWYVKVDGVWKLSESQSAAYWSEYDLFGTVTPK